jgi:hypothetical protein
MNEEEDIGPGYDSSQTTSWKALREAEKSFIHNNIEYDVCCDPRRGYWRRAQNDRFSIRDSSRERTSIAPTVAIRESEARSGLIDRSRRWHVC